MISGSIWSRAKVLDFLIFHPHCTVVLVLLFVLATDAAAQSRERLWTVTCGLPQQDNPFLALLPSQHVDSWPDGSRSGHLGSRMLHRGHPDGGISTEMWLLSHSIGWWRLKAIRVHPDDRSKLTVDPSENLRRQIRQIVESPFLSRPAVILAGDPDAEEMVNGQILALLPDAARVAAAQRALARHGHDPGPIDGRMGPRTRAALRAFQAERGLAPYGQLDDATFEWLR